MNPDKLFESLREEVKRQLPPEMHVSSIEFEGSVIVIYTTDYDKFSGNDDMPRTLAQSLKRRVDIRPDPSTLDDPGPAREKILSMIPQSAEIFDINFIEETGEAIIEAINTSEVLGKEGQLLSDIKKECGWNVKVMRAPPIPSKMVSDVRGYIYINMDDRHKFLKSVARKLVRP
ncbi:MAG: beta-CASP ribonuclease aCPSF1, partial [Candidatus Methanoplasma sp.]|nr:beta-CASP ribonuclease aCPSF1 [Candidatus Methanoplasma sp.]